MKELLQKFEDKQDQSIKWLSPIFELFVNLHLICKDVILNFFISSLAFENCENQFTVESEKM